MIPQQAQPVPSASMTATPTQSGMAPQDAMALQKILLAAQKVMYDPKIFPTFRESLEAPGPWPQKLALQASGLIKILDERSPGGIPRQLLVPAAVAILMEMVDFVQKAKMATLGQEDIKTACQVVIGSVLKEYGVLDKMRGAQGAAPAPAPATPTPPPGLVAGAQQQMGA